MVAFFDFEKIFGVGGQKLDRRKGVPAIKFGNNGHEKCFSKMSLKGANSKPDGIV